LTNYIDKKNIILYNPTKIKEPKFNMKYISILLIIFFALPLSAKMLISPMDVMKQSYGSNSKISKKDIVLTSKQAKKIQQYAKTKLKSKKFKVFKATKAGKTLGFGLLVNRKVRSKNVCRFLYNLKIFCFKKYRANSLQRAHGVYSIKKVDTTL